MIKLTTEDLLVRGVLATARDWPGYALAISNSLHIFSMTQKPQTTIALWRSNC